MITTTRTNRLTHPPSQTQSPSPPHILSFPPPFAAHPSSPSASPPTSKRKTGKTREKGRGGGGQQRYRGKKNQITQFQYENTPYSPAACYLGHVWAAQPPAPPLHKKKKLKLKSIILASTLLCACHTDQPTDRSAPPL